MMYYFNASDIIIATSFDFTAIGITKNLLIIFFDWITGLTKTDRCIFVKIDRNLLAPPLLINQKLFIYNRLIQSQ